MCRQMEKVYKYQDATVFVRMYDQDKLFIHSTNPDLTHSPNTGFDLDGLAMLLANDPDLNQIVKDIVRPDNETWTDYTYQKHNGDIVYGLAVNNRGMTLRDLIHVNEHNNIDYIEGYLRDIYDLLWAIGQSIPLPTFSSDMPTDITTMYEACTLQFDDEDNIYTYKEGYKRCIDERT